MNNYVEPKNYKEVDGYVLCSKYSHKIGNFEAIPNADIDGEWEIMRVSKETDDCFYGMSIEGLGLIDCMILKKDCRAFKEEELKAWQNRTIGIYGSHSDKLSYCYKVEVKDLMACFKKVGNLTYPQFVKFCSKVANEHYEYEVIHQLLLHYQMSNDRSMFEIIESMQLGEFKGFIRKLLEKEVLVI